VLILRDVPNYFFWKEQKNNYFELKESALKGLYTKEGIP
jgi:hypothetical protein